MNILVVSSKYPPEYSGSGNRISLLYDRLKKKYDSISLHVICNSTEYVNSNKEYIYKNIKVSRVSSNLINKKHGLFYKVFKLVDIYIEEIPNPISIDDPSWNTRDIALDAIKALSSFGQFLIQIIIFLFVFTPVWILIAGIIYGTSKLRQRKK